jgi:hypothetical protein
MERVGVAGLDAVRLLLEERAELSGPRGDREDLQARTKIPLYD